MQNVLCFLFQCSSTVTIVSFPRTVCTRNRVSSAIRNHCSSGCTSSTLFSMRWRPSNFSTSLLNVPPNRYSRYSPCFRLPLWLRFRIFDICSVNFNLSRQHSRTEQLLDRYGYHDIIHWDIPRVGYVLVVRARYLGVNQELMHDRRACPGVQGSG